MGNVTGKLSVLIAPGFWKKFTKMWDGFSLAQTVLRGSAFKCYVLASGHHASNAADAQELNPQITGSTLEGPPSLFLYLSSWSGRIFGEGSRL